MATNIRLLTDAVAAGYDIIPILGQSNAKGTNTDYDLANIDVPDVRIFAYQQGGASPNAIVAASARLQPPAIDTLGGISFGHAFAKLWLSQAKPGRRVLLVPCAVGGTGFDAWGASPSPQATWKVGSHPDGVSNLYDLAVTQIQGALAAAGQNSRVVAVLWHQGEADSNIAVTETTYATNLDALIDGLRSSIPALATAPFLVGQMAPERLSTQAGTAGPNAAHINTPARKTLTGFAKGTAGYCAADNTHYLAQGQRLLAGEYWAAYWRALANVKGAPPAAPASVAMSTANTTTTITWTGSVGRVTDYLVEVQMLAGGAWTAVSHTASPQTWITVTGSTPPVAARVSAVNECGTSTATATPAVQASGGSSGAVPDAPGAPTVVTPSATSLLAGVKAATGATGYTWQYRVTGGSSWTSAGTTTSPYQTITGLTADTAYDVRAFATNTNGSSASGAISSVKTSNGQTSLTLGRAHGLRRIVSGYTGPLVQVRRSTDQATQDIGQSGVDLNIGDLLDFVGAGSAYITTIYDQSGNARHMTQATAAKQPRIVNAGAIDTLNNRPAPVYDGAATYLKSTVAGVYAAGAATIAAIVRSAGDSNVSGRVFGEWRSTSANAYWQISQETSRTLGVSIRNDAATTLLAAPSSAETPALPVATGTQLTIKDDGSTVKRWVDAAAMVDKTYTRSGTVTVDQSILGGNVRNGTEANWWNGQIAEVAVAYTALGDTDRQALMAAQKAYYQTA